MIKIYSTKWCAPCKAAKQLLDSLGKTYDVIDIEDNNISRDELVRLTGGSTVPQIIINDKPIGGFDNLREIVWNEKLEDTINNV
tara:strand:- start:1309 stop:1560 length:252 start_codon:yes stop_codon:yes gene_type:complete